MLNKVYEGKAQRGADQTIRLLNRLPIEGRRCLDLGCNEGLVAAFMKQQGAAEVIGYEPHPAAYKVANAMSKSGGYVVFNKAVMTERGKFRLRVSIEDEEHDYYCNATIDMDQDRQDSHYVEVSAVPFREVIAEFEPHGLKIDVEGSEWDLLLKNKVGKEAQWICVEVHWLKSVGAFLLPFLVDKMADQSFGIQDWPSGLKLKSGAPDCFHPFSVMNFVRGVRTRKEHREILETFRKLGRRRHRAGAMTRLPTRQALVDFCYGERK